MNTKKKSLRVCVIIPAFNEARVIGSVVKQINQRLNVSPYTFQVVVVNDGSKDETAHRASKNGAFVIDHVLNTGAGGATATGLSYAEQQGFDIAVTMDADGQHHADDVIKGLDEIVIRRADLLIGSRLINNEGMSRVKILGNKGLSVITYLLFGINVTDSQSGLRVFSKKALAKLRWKTSGYEFCSEMLWRAKQLGLTVQEYSIQAIYTDYSKGKGQNNWNGIVIVKNLLRRRIVEVLE